jgi:SAM-dependent methyltransferase/uncharacterized protein (DUF2062 family)
VAADKTRIVGAGRFKLRGAVLRAYLRMRGSELTPLRFALSVAVGLFVGCLPLYGVHFFLCAALTMPLRLNLLVAYAAAHISIPPSLPVLWFIALQLGSLALTGAWLPLQTTDMTPARVAALGGTLLFGSVLLGALLATFGGGLTYLAARFAGSRGGVPTDAVLLEAAILRTARRYRDAPPAARHYVRFKLLLDPLAEQLLFALRRIVPAAPAVVLDAGCGRGQYSLLLHELGLAKEIFGFDHDAAKVAIAAQAAAAGPERNAAAASYAARDLRQGPHERADLVLLFDVLHYLTRAEQIDVLRQAAAALLPGGHILLRETDRGAGPGAWLAGWFERVGRKLGINRGEVLELTSTQTLADVLEGLGLAVLSRERGTLDNVLLIARKA